VTARRGRSRACRIYWPLSQWQLFDRALSVGDAEPIVAATSKTAIPACSRASRSGVTDVLSVSREGLWLRQGGDDRAEL